MSSLFDLKFLNENINKVTYNDGQVISINPLNVFNLYYSKEKGVSVVIGLKILISNENVRTVK